MQLTRIALVLGLAVLTALVLREGVQSIAGLLARAGWTLLWLVPLHVLPLWFDVMGWRVLIAGACRVRTLLFIAAVREAVNRLLPVANIGGELAGIQLLSGRGIEPARSAASVIVEVALTLVAQYFFLVLGVVCLLRQAAGVRLSAALLVTLLAGLPVLAVLLWLLRSGVLFAALRRMATRLLGARALGVTGVGWSQLDAAIRELATAHGRMARAVVWQFTGLVAGCLETWLSLRLIGHPAGFFTALALESVALAARTFVFVVPAGLGVQEAGLIGVGGLLGIGPDVAIALSLVKRMREVVFGVPALGLWQWHVAHSVLLNSSRRDIEAG